MATQQQIAEHLDMSQQQVSIIMGRLGIDWKNTGIDEIRIAYFRYLRMVIEIRQGGGAAGIY